jgi:hypothetical protein
MADNTLLNPGTGGDLIATDDLTTLNGGAVSGVKAQRVKVGFGSDASLRDVDATNGLPVLPLATELHLGQVGGHTAAVSASFNRPADTVPYNQGDLVANSTTAGSVTPVALVLARVAAGGGVIRKLRLIKSTATLTNALFRVHLYNAAPTVSNGDNAAFAGPGALNYIDAFDVTMDQAFTDGAVGFGFPRHGPDVSFKLASGQTVYALIEFRGAATYTPGSAETFTVVAETQQD